MNFEPSIHFEQRKRKWRHECKRKQQKLLSLEIFAEHRIPCKIEAKLNAVLQHHFPKEIIKMIVSILSDIPTHIYAATDNKTLFMPLHLGRATYWQKIIDSPIENEFIFFDDHDIKPSELKNKITLNRTMAIQLLRSWYQWKLFPFSDHDARVTKIIKQLF